MKKIIDLSHIYDEKLTKYDNEDVALFRQTKFYEAHGYKETNINIDTHVGTHMDAPSHIFSGYKNVDELEIENFVGKALIIKVKNDGEMGEDILKNYEKELSNIDFIVFNTGWDRYWGEKRYYEHPYLSLNLAKKISEYSNIKAVGIDTFSVDKYGDPFLEVHKTLLRSNKIYIMENLCNIDKISKEIAEIICLPLKIKGIDGGPVRVIAIEE
ncbi:cyclase family protein [Fusobacterium sp. SYSU M8A802]